MKKKGKVTQTVHIPLSLSLFLLVFIVMKQIYIKSIWLTFFYIKKKIEKKMLQEHFFFFFFKKDRAFLCDDLILL